MPKKACIIENVSKSLSSSSSSSSFSSSVSWSEICLPKDLVAGCGTIQLTCLGIWLQKLGFEWWNLGHPPKGDSMIYKRSLGGRVYARKNFLKMWTKSTNIPLNHDHCNGNDDPDQKDATGRQRNRVKDREREFLFETFMST